MKEDALTDNRPLKVTSIELPENNAFSFFIVGPDDFVEFNSIGNNSRSDSVLVNKLNKSEVTLTAFIYIDGNDPRITNERLALLNDHSGQIKISFELGDAVTD